MLVCDVFVCCVFFVVFTSLYALDANWVQYLAMF
jgi:hypothetical protein